MRVFLKLLFWDFTFAVRYHIVTVAALVTALYASVFLIFDGYELDLVLKIMLFSDPTMLGFMFVGALILFEKDSHVLQAIAVSPLKQWQYIWSKAVVLTVIALLSSLGMTISAVGMNFNPFYLVTSITLSSILFVFIGIIGVSKVKSFTRYILTVPLFLAPAILPLLNFFKLTDTIFLYAIPTQATLDLLDAAIGGTKFAKVIYGHLYLMVWVGISFMIARNRFKKHIIKQK